MIMRYRLTAAALFLMITQTIQANGWMDSGEEPSSLAAGFDDDSDQYLSALTRDEEQEIHSPLISGFKYVSGGAGEGQQHLSPNGEFPNHLEVKTDEELPSYCDPPNPCPLGFEGEDCDASPMSAFTADYSRMYQAEQDCQCDKDHDDCYSNNALFPSSLPGSSKDVLKRSRRVRRDTHRQVKGENETKGNARTNPYRQGQTLRFHVAKKSPISLTS